MRYCANKEVSRWRQCQRRQDLHQKQYVPLPFDGGHNYKQKEADSLLHNITSYTQHLYQISKS